MSAAFDSDVTVTLEIGFVSDPKDTSITWVDVTADLRSFNIRRGRSHERDGARAGTLHVTLSNSSRDYDPTYTSGTHYPDVKPGKPIRLRANYNSTDYDLFRGTIDGWPQLFPHKGKDAVVQIKSTDDFKLIAQDTLVSTEVAELSGTRVGNILDDVSWPAGRRSLDAGIFTMVGSTVECVNPLTELQKVVDSENGFLFMDGAGDVVFHDYDHRPGLASSGTFGPGNLGYADVVVAYDDLQVWNSITASRAGSTTQTAQEDSDSVTAYGRRKLRLHDLLLNSDADLANLAGTYIARYKNPQIRVSSLVFQPQSDPAGLWPHALGAELSDRYLVEVAPPGGGGNISESVHVEAVSHDVTISPRKWNVGFQLSPYFERVLSSGAAFAPTLSFPTGNLAYDQTLVGSVFTPTLSFPPGGVE